MFEKARKWGYLKDASNPAQDAEIGRGNKGGRTIWTPTIDEARAIVGHADDDVALIVELIVWTGMRISEVLGLRCRNVDPDQAWSISGSGALDGIWTTPKALPVSGPCLLGISRSGCGH
jgi:integrase